MMLLLRYTIRRAFFGEYSRLFSDNVKPRLSCSDCWQNYVLLAVEVYFLLWKFPVFEVHLINKHPIIWLLVLAGCSADTPPQSVDSSATQPGFSSQTTLNEVYEVEYQDGVAVIDEDTMQHLQSSSNGTLTFSKDAQSLRQLSSGQVVIFSGHALGRVASVLVDDDVFIVATTPAKFIDAYKNATIELVTRVDWHKPVPVAIAPKLQLISSAFAAGETDWSIKKNFEYKGVKADVTFKPKSADRLEVEINASIAPQAKMSSITREESVNNGGRETVTADQILDPDADLDYTAGLTDPESSTPDGTAAASVAKVQVSGHVSGFVQALQINVRNSALQKFDFRLQELSGEIRVEGAGLQDAAGSFEISLPLEYTIPLVVGPIPVAVKMGASIKLTPQVHLGSSKFCFKAEYAAATGLSFESGSLKNQSSVRRKKVDLCGEEETVSAGQITVGFGASANVPEISLLIFGNNHRAQCWPELWRDKLVRTRHRQRDEAVSVRQHGP